MEQNIIDYLIDLIAKKLEVDPQEINTQDSFFDLGIESILTQEIIKEMSIRFGGLKPILLFEYPNIEKLAHYLYEKNEKSINDQNVTTIQSNVNNSNPKKPPFDVSDHELWDPNKPAKPKEVIQLSDQQEDEIHSVEEKMEEKGDVLIHEEIFEEEKEREEEEADEIHTIIAFLADIISEELNLEKETVTVDLPFVSMRIESTKMLQLVTKIGNIFEGLNPNIFFEYSNIKQLAMYLSSLPYTFPSDEPEPTEDQELVEGEIIQSDEEMMVEDGTTAIHHLCPQPCIPSGGVAVIGMSGRFPYSSTPEEFWKILTEGRDCIIEIPKERWNHSKFYNSDKNNKTKTYGKWGSFIDDVDKFDPLFFKISPKEAEEMDPQQRLFLEISWEAMEDAGYAVFEKVKEKRVGVYVGAAWNDYSQCAHEVNIVNHAYGGPGSLYWMIANRVSYFFDFRGPSLTIDTACSSSLTALHIACQDILTRECEIAIAGGVNLSLHPSKYLYLGQAKFLAEDGRCRSFGEGGSGYVPGEGVAAVVLKPLDLAIEDNDQIHGIIRGSSVNHGGRAAGFTVPNPEAQAALILRALRVARVNPKDIGYIECHGTGTSLGDPVELQGLSKAFEQYTEEKQFCPIGSIKSIIGHLEAAAGIAGVIKALLCLKYKMIPKNLHSKVLNPNLKFEETPFYVPQENIEWNDPGKETRLAAVSSFGAGGSNAHVILEEYIWKAVDSFDDPLTTEAIPLSAVNQDRLKLVAERLLKFLKNKTIPISLQSLAYTLQTGRETFKHRLLIFSDSLRDLEKKLEKFLETNEESDGIHLNNTPIKKSQKNLLEGALYDPDLLDFLVDSQKTNTLGILWLHGIKVDWSGLYKDRRRKRISLPCYPFERKKYWLPEIEEPTSTGTAIHPLLDSGSITINGAEYKKRLTKKQFYIHDHIVQNHCLLPGVAYLEITQTAANLVNQCGLGIQIKSLNWLKPIIVKSEPVDVLVKMIAEKGKTSFTIQSGMDEEEILHCRGEIVPFVDSEIEKSAPVPEVEAIKQRCPKFFFQDKEKIYEQYRLMGFCYGESFQCTEALYWNDQEGLALLSLPENTPAVKEQFTLHPSLMDSALRLALCIPISGGQALENPNIPFSLGKLTLFGPLPNRCVAYARKNGSKRKKSTFETYNIYIYDTSLRLLVIMENFYARAYKEKSEAITARSNFYYPTWQVSDAITGQKEKIKGKNSLIFLDKEESEEEAKQRFPNAVFVQVAKEFQKVDANHYMMNPIRYDEYTLLFQELEANNRFPDCIVHLWSFIYEFSQFSDFPFETPELWEFENRQDLGLYSAFHLFKAVNEVDPNHSEVFLFLSPRANNTGFPEFESVGAFSKAITKINFHFKMISIQIDPEILKPIPTLQIALQELENPENANGTELLYQQNRRFVRSIFPWAHGESEEKVDKKPLLKKGGVYLITGGLGGLGLLFANWLAKSYQAKLLLTGRSPLTTNKERAIQELKQQGSEVLYLVSDISDYQSMVQAILQGREKFGPINGVIHNAGVLDPTMIPDCDHDRFADSCSAKMKGTIILDQLTREEPLEFFALFSSLSSQFGDFGSGSYGASNRFLDSFAELRNEKAKNGRRSGKTVSILWPYWKEGTMRLSKEDEKLYSGYLGFSLMETDQGLISFEQAIQSNRPQVIVGCGNRLKIEKAFQIKGTKQEKMVAARTVPAKVSKKTIPAIPKAKQPPVAVQAKPIPVQPVAAIKPTSSTIQNELVQITADLLKMQPLEVEVDKDLTDYGMDSVMMMEFQQKLTERYGEDIPSTLLFEYTTIEALTDYLVENFASTQPVSQQESPPVPPPAAPVTYQEQPPAEAAGADGTQLFLQKIASDLLKLEPEEIEADKDLTDYGMDSVMMMEFQQKLTEKYGEEIPSTLLFEYTTIEALVEYLVENFAPIQPAPQQTLSQEVPVTTQEMPPTSQPVMEQVDSQKPQIERVLREIASGLLKLEPEDMDPDTDLTDYGMDSVMMMEFQQKLTEKYGDEIPSTLLFEYTTINDLERFLVENILPSLPEPTVPSLPKPVEPSPVQKIPKAETKDPFLITPQQPERKLSVTDEFALPAEESVFPLSFAQLSQWYIATLDPSCWAYNVPTGMVWNRKIDIPTLIKAFKKVLIKQPMLRSVFRKEEEGPKQIIRNDLSVDLQHLDVSFWDEERIQQRIDQETETSFSLDRGPNWRVLLLSHSEEKHTLIITVHHIIHDGLSTVIMAKDLFDFYEAEINGTPITPQPVEKGYDEFIQWQKEWIGSPKGEKCWNYWKNQLSGELPPLTLPFDKPRPETQTYNGKSISCLINREETEGLKALAKENKTTLFNVLLSCYLIFLNRNTGQDDLLVGTPTIGRTTGGYKKTVGFLMNMVVLRENLSGNPDFPTLLKSVTKMSREAIVHQEFPLPLIVERLNVPRDPSRSPIFQSDFILQNFDSSIAKELEEEGVELFYPDQQSGQFDFSVEIFEEKDSLRVHLKYNQDLFEITTIQRFAEHYRRIALEVLKNPNSKVREIPILTEEEEKKLLIEWNQTEVDYPKEFGLHQLFAQQAEKFPDATAAIFAGETISYDELNKRANRLAHHLQKLGAGPNVMIAILMERSLEMLIGLFGILKSGSAYIPMDPSFPAERLGYMLEDSEAPVILTQKSLLEDMPNHQAKVVVIDQIEEELAQESDENPTIDHKPENLAYVIFTSGSTGRPKGVQIQHKAIVNFIISMGKVPGFSSNDTVLSVTTISFDISTLEMFLPLLKGGTVVIASYEDTLDGFALQSLMDRHEVTMLQATPATWRILEETEWKGNSQLKALCGGEPLPPDLAKVLLKKTESLWNMYGPTETTVWSTLEKVEPNRKILIGKPIDNTTIYVLNDKLLPVPTGVAGQLFIGGVALSPGYLKRPDLTQDKFIQSPFENPLENNPDNRIYNTGDLAKYMPDGKLECLGRVDNQVKIRGFRIELGDIEAVLSIHPSIKVNAVIAREVEGDKILVAYFVPDSANIPTSRELAEFIKKSLPPYMVPSLFIQLETMPLTPNGKIDRKALPAPVTEMETEEPEMVEESDNEVEASLVKAWKEILHLDKVSVHDNFFDLGGHSLKMAQLHTRLKKEIGLEISLGQLMRLPTIRALNDFIIKNQAVKDVSKGETQKKAKTAKTVKTSNDMAIIGMACRLPKSDNIDQFWENLREGKECITFFQDEELKDEGISEALYKKKNYVKARGYLEDVGWFDHEFFGFTPMEAQITDPQQRLFLEVVWEALEDAGYDTRRENIPIGVFGGSGMNSYLSQHILPNQDLIDRVGNYMIMVGNDKDFLCTRVSYKLNLEGPSVVVQSACSTSLVAIDSARKALIDETCPIAIVGGVSMLEYGKRGYLHQIGMILSSDGHCRTFDSKADGTLSSNGAGAIVLKMLKSAIKDGDNIHAIIKGSAINNDGSMKIGYTAPRVEGQANVIRGAQKIANVSSDSISYIEAHGTATKLGDPIEIDALTQAFRMDTDKRGFCRIGSLKSCMGHLDAAAGVAGVIKTALALKHKQIPPSLHYEKPNPEIDFESSPFIVNNQLTDWKRGDTPRRAGISAFGIGGTNAHVILEEAPTFESHESSKKKLIPLTAKTETALNKIVQNLKSFLDQKDSINMDDLAYTLQTGRREFEYRTAISCENREDAIEALNTMVEKPDIRISSEDSKVVFMFSGQGSQYANMGLELYEKIPFFKQQVDEALEYLKNELNLNLSPMLFPEKGKLEEATKLLKQTRYTQPALFVMEYSLAKLWMHWGLKPDYMIGHSVGEYVAACIAGVFSLEDGLRLITKRGELIWSLPQGDMLSVPLSESEAEPFLEEGVSIATINTPNRCALSGTPAAIKKVADKMKERDIRSVILQTSHAFHSSMMEPILEEFEREVNAISMKSPRIPYVSNVSGTWITKEQATSGKYWGQHLRQAVRFSDGIGTLSKKKNLVYLEVGPGTVLTTLASQNLKEQKEATVLASMRHPGKKESDYGVLLTALGQLWTTGQSVDWKQLYRDENRRKISLPTYPFEREYHWVGKTESPEKKEKQRGPANIYTPQWKELDRFDHEETVSLLKSGKMNWLIFADDQKFRKKITTILKEHDHNVVLVKRGKKFSKTDDGHDYCISPEKPDHYIKLLEQLRQAELVPNKVVHGWNLERKKEPNNQKGVHVIQNSGFYGLLFLTQAIATKELNEQIDLVVVSTQTHKFEDQDEVIPAKATVLAAKVIQQEFNNIFCKNIDLPLNIDFEKSEDSLIRILGELYHCDRYEDLIHRGDRRFIRSFEPIAPEKQDGLPVREKGIYLITGGTGGIGLTLAHWLAKQNKVHLILQGRSPFPDRSSWDQYSDKDGLIYQKVRAIQEIEELGSQVTYLQADIAKQAVMEAKIKEINREYGTINGVIHSAGIMKTELITELTPNSVEGGFQPKLYGTKVLQQLLGKNELDFQILCSSITSQLGGSKQFDYCAANHYLDALAEQIGKQNGRCVSINWDAWKDVGMGVNLEVPENLKQWKQKRLQSGLSNEQAVNALELALCDPKSSQYVIINRQLEIVQEEQESILRAAKKPSSQTEAKKVEKPEESVKSIWNDFLGLKASQPDDNFYQLGGDSLLAVNMIAKLSEHFGIDFEPHTLMTNPTLEKLINHVVSKTESDATPTEQRHMVELNPGDKSKPPLFLVHPVDGELFLYRDFPETIGKDQPLYGFQAIRRDNDSEDIKELAQRYLKELLAFQPEGPYFLGGASFGGLVALEMAQQMLDQGKQVETLVLIDSPIAEGVPEKLKTSTKILKYLFSDSLSFSEDKLKEMSLEEQVEFIRQIAKKQDKESLIPSNFDVSYVKAFLAFQLCMFSYEPKTYTGKTLFFRPTERSRYLSLDLHVPWQRIIPENLTIHTVPGNHITMNYKPNVSEIMKYLKEIFKKD